MWKPMSHLGSYITADCEALQRVNIRSLGPVKLRFCYRTEKGIAVTVCGAGAAF